MAGLIQTGALEPALIDDTLSREPGGTLVPSATFIAYLTGGSDLNKLREPIGILNSHGIKIGGYLPCGEFWFPELFSQYRLSEPWNSPHNALLASQMPDQFRCSCAGSSGSEYQTTYVAVVGPDTVLRTSDHVPRRLEEVSKDAVMLIELSDKPRHWMAPTDTSLEELTLCFGETPSDWGQHGHYVAADGRVRPIREITPSVLLQRIATPSAN